MIHARGSPTRLPRVRTVRAAAVAAALALGLAGWTPYGAAAQIAAGEPVDLGGRPIEGSTDSARPTPLGPGLWATTLGPQSQPQHFTYERQIEDSTVHIGVVGTPLTAEYDGFTLASSVTTADDAEVVDCGTGDASSDSIFPQAPIGDQVVIGAEDASDDPCHSAETIALTVERASTSSLERLPVAIKIVEEAPVSARGEPWPDDKELDYEVPEPTEAADGPQGADAFDDAPVVDAHDGTVTIAADVMEGTTLLWRVPLEWDDQLVLRGDLASVAADGPLAGVAVQARIVQPSRDVYALTESEDYYYDDFGEEPGVLVAASYPLRYDNRFHDFEPTLPGDAWVLVSVEPAPVERSAMTVTVDLTIAVSAGGDNAPTYKGAVLAQGGGAGPDGYSPDEPYLVGDGEFSAVASGSPFAADSEDDSWWGPRRYAGLGLGVVSLVCCVAGAVWLSRRRAH